MEEIDIYTDCSLKNNNLGISAFIINEDETETILRYKTNTQLLNKEFQFLNGILNPFEYIHPEEYIHIGECYAILKTLFFIREKNYSKVRIYTDSDQVFLILNKCKCNYSKRNILLKLVSDKCSAFINDSVEILWIKAHCGVYGNEIADSIAKKSRRRTEKKIENKSFLPYRPSNKETKIFLKYRQKS